MTNIQNNTVKSPSQVLHNIVLNVANGMFKNKSLWGQVLIWVLILPIIQILCQSYSFYSESSFLHEYFIGAENSVWWAYGVCFIFEIAKIYAISSAIVPLLKDGKIKVFPILFALLLSTGSILASWSTLPFRPAASASTLCCMLSIHSS